MKIPAHLKSLRFVYTGAHTVKVVITLEQVPVSMLGLFWDLPQGWVELEIKALQEALQRMGEPEDVVVPKAFL